MERRLNRRRFINPETQSRQLREDSIGKYMQRVRLVILYLITTLTTIFYLQSIELLFWTIVVDRICLSLDLVVVYHDIARAISSS